MGPTADYTVYRQTENAEILKKQGGKRMFNMNEIGRRIAELRKKADMTQLELADRLGVRYQAVSNWERGSSMPDIMKLPELASIFDTTIDKLLGEETVH